MAIGDVWKECKVNRKKQRELRSGKAIACMGKRRTLSDSSRLCHQGFFFENFEWIFLAIGHILELLEAADAIHQAWQA